MGTHRTPDQLKSEIVRGTRHIIAGGGMESFSYPKLTALTGISAPTVYEHYKNKEDLLTTCFMMIDCEIAHRMERLIRRLKLPAENADKQEIEELCRMLWISYWEYLVADADRTIFYWNFYNSPYYTDAIRKKRNRNFVTLLGFIQVVDERLSVSKKCNLDMLVANIVNGTVAAAVKTLKGVYPNNGTTEATVYHMVFQPVFSVLGIRAHETNEVG